MEQVLPISGLILAGVLSPGPNNVLVMTQAVHGGLCATFGLMLGIVLGTLGLVLLCWFGAQGLFEMWPFLRTLMKGGGCCYLLWLGGRLMWANQGSAEDTQSRGSIWSKSTGFALFCFQFLNPKAWVLVLTVVATQPGTPAGHGGLLPLMALFTLLSGVCLLLWAQVGQWLSHWLNRGLRQLYFDRAMGMVLICSAASLVLVG